jgi:hypothetical protein
MACIQCEQEIFGWKFVTVPVTSSDFESFLKSSQKIRKDDALAPCLSPHTNADFFTNLRCYEPS